MKSKINVIMKREKKTSPQCLVWFRLNGLGSSQNSLIHNWCIGGCWVTAAQFVVGEDTKIIL
jgi:hypothetical protein